MGALPSFGLHSGAVMTFRLPEPQSNVYKDAAPPPGLDIHRGRTDEGAYVFELQTVAGEIDGELLTALLAYTERVNQQRGRRWPPLTLIVASPSPASSG